MRMSVAQQLSDLNTKLMGYIGLMSYRYCNICVKAEASSLLSFEQSLGGVDMQIEDVADVYVHEKERDGDNVTMRLLPKQPHYVQIIVQGIMEIHPEFKLTLEKYDEDIEDEKDSMANRYVRLVMPEVDKDRRDLLLNLIDVMYNACCAKMDAVIAKKTAEITKITANDEASALDEAKEAIDAQKKQYEDMRETLTEDKKKEVEDAYQYYLQKDGTAPDKKNGNDGKTAMYDESKSDAKESESKESSKRTEKKQQDNTKSKPKNAQESDNSEKAGQSLSMD